MEETVCPSRQLRESPELVAFVDWFLWSAERDPWGGGVTGVRSWPGPGGVLEQPAVVVEAVEYLIGEWRYLKARKAPKPKTEDAEPEEAEEN